MSVTMLVFEWLQKDLADHKKELSASESNLVDTLGANSPAVQSIASRQHDLDRKLLGASEMAASLQDHVNVCEHNRQQLIKDVCAVDNSLNDLRQELNQIDITGPSSSPEDDNLSEKYDLLTVSILTYYTHSQ